MKRLKFLETKRTPRYSLRKLNVGMASVLLGVTIFGINFTNHSVKAATTESVENSNSSAKSRLQQITTQEETSATEKVQQGSADTDIKSLAAKSAAKLAFMNLMAASDNGTGTDNGTDRMQEIQ